MLLKLSYDESLSLSTDELPTADVTVGNLGVTIVYGQD